MEYMEYFYLVIVVVILFITIIIIYKMFDKGNNFITEDDIVNWINNGNNLLHTRKISNIDTYLDFTENKNLIVCLTGYHHIIDDFFKNKLDKMNYPITLITIESDIIPIKQYIEHPLIKHWYSWNIDHSHPKLTCIPIGLNKDRQSYSLDTYMKNPSKEKTKLLCVSQSNDTNSIRGILYNKAINEWSHFCDVLQYVEPKRVYNIRSLTDGSLKINVSHPDYYSYIDEYKFILSPRGAGEDCHRTWESLYLGVIPIVMKSPISDIYKGLPVLEIDDWDNINKEFLEEQYSIIMNKKNNGEYDMDKLTIEYWIDKIKCR
jgi:hypothetical protein